MRGPPRGGPPPERQISFTNVIAPKLARFNPADQTYSDDEVLFLIFHSDKITIFIFSAALIHI